MNEDSSSDGANNSSSLRRSRRNSPSIATISNLCPETRSISGDFLKIWNQLPEQIHSDPNLAFVQDEYHKRPKNFSGAAEINLHPPHYIQQLQEVLHNNPKNEKSMDRSNSEKTTLCFLGQCIKLSLLVTCWIMFFVSLLITIDKGEIVQQVIAGRNEIIMINSINSDRIGVTVESSLILNGNQHANQSISDYYLSVWVETSSLNNSTHELFPEQISTVWTIPLLPSDQTGTPLLRKATQVLLLNLSNRSDDQLSTLKLKSNYNATIPFIVSYDQSPINTDYGIWYGAILLVGLYILIISEVVHKAIAAMLASTSSLAVLAILNQKPTMMEILSWIDIDTLLLLFSMMILVAIISDTGVFDYLAVFAYKITKGDVWSLVCTLCLFTAVTSAFLDNVTIILLITPVTIRLCEVMQLNPVPILTTMVIFSNIGGGATPVGDPPNVIIASHHDVVDAKIDFGIFTAHMSIGIIIVLFVMYGHFRFVFRNLDVLRSNVEPKDVQELNSKIAIWKEAMDNLPTNTRDESLVKETMAKQIQRFNDELEQAKGHSNQGPDHFESTLKDLQKKYPIKKKWLLVKSGFSIVFVLILFFFHSLPQFHLTLGWTAFMGVLLLLVLANNEDFDNILVRIEWGTLLFFAALFVMMEALSKLGLITWIGKQTELIILSVNEEFRLAVAILLVLWLSALGGAIFDNVPLITMLIRIVVSLSENKELNLPLQPLIWALAFGACLGGNGTLIGATANVVCAGVAEQHGYHLTFMTFFKLGFPALITSNIVVTIYLMVAHVVFEWNN